MHGANVGLQASTNELYRDLQVNTNHISNILVQLEYLKTELCKIKNGEGTQ